MSVDDCRMIEFPVFSDARGKLAVIEPGLGSPFPIRRVFYLFDVPPGAQRGGHAHSSLEELIFAASGSFDVVLDDGRTRKTVRMGDPRLGLYVPPMIWLALENFTSDAVCMVVASLPYDEFDCHTDRGEFVRSIRGT
jgi:dTDP-4-dehydrorhamnose 3,5-epimerase-like enzyme